MSREISQTALRAMFAQETEEVFLICLRISHPDITTFRLVNNTEPVVRLDGTYQPYPFEVVLPKDTEGQVPQVNLVVDNVDREVSRQLENLQGRPRVEFEVVLASQPDTIEAGPFDFSLMNATVNAIVISGTLGYEDNILNQAFPAQSYSPINSPGLYA